MKEYEGFSDMNPNIDLSSEELKEIANIRMSSITRNLQASMSAASQLGPVMSTALLNAAAQIAGVSLGPIVQALESYSQYITETVALFQIARFPEEHRKKLAESYRAWGKCGWAWVGATPLKFYNTPPQNAADANKRIKPYVSQSEIEELFERLHSKKLRSSDLDSAIFCYQNRQYKPCALMLFGMIDAKLIRKQTTIKDYRPAGGKAADKLREQFEQTNDRVGFFSLLRFANLFSCLETVFASGKNFKNEPAVINRNYIDHGINQRPVLKRDCIQLFFILDNLLDFLDYPSKQQNLRCEQDKPNCE